MQTPSLFFLHDSTTVLGFPIPTQLSFIPPPLLPRNIFRHAHSSSFIFIFPMPFLRDVLRSDLMWELRTVHFYTLVLAASSDPQEVWVCFFFNCIAKSSTNLDMLVVSLAPCLNAINLLLSASASGKDIIINIYGKDDSFRACRTGRSWLSNSNLREQVIISRCLGKDRR